MHGVFRGTWRQEPIEKLLTTKLRNLLIHPRQGCGKYCDQRVCMYVCLSFRSLTSKTIFQVSSNFLHTLPVAVARSSSDGNSIRYVLPLLWMTSCSTYSNRAKRLFSACQPSIKYNKMQSKTADSAPGAATWRTE